jgi:hypothetical protein
MVLPLAAETNSIVLPMIGRPFGFGGSGSCPLVLINFTKETRHNAELNTNRALHPFSANILNMLGYPLPLEYGGPGPNELC